MRSAGLCRFGVALALGCTRAAAPAASTGTPAPVSPRLPPPPPLDLDAPDAPYRAALALQLQPGWAQFLDDCRLRLPATHALNVMSLAATADLVIDATGKVTEVTLASSANADFDRAARQVIRDAAPLPRPPPALWSDDDRVHVRWLFARDGRQAGPATASVVEIRLPVVEVVTRMIGSGDLTRAARRLRHEPNPDAITALMTAGLREALAGTDDAVRRAAVVAIGAANIAALAGEIDDLLASTSDVELRLAAMHTTAVLGNHTSVHALAQHLALDIKTDRRVALGEAEALVALDGASDVRQIALPFVLDRSAADPIALHVLGVIPGAFDRSPDLTKALTRAQQSADARMRAGVCAATSRASGAFAQGLRMRGLRDRDATVRAACLDAVTARMAELDGTSDVVVGAATIDRIAELVKDRDVQVRAAAIRALAAVAAEPDDAPPAPLHGTANTKRTAVVHVWEPSAFPDLSGDGAAEVRAAYLQALRSLSQLRPLPGGQARVRSLLDDRDPVVRAAAWQTLVVLLRKPIDRIEGDPPPADFAQLVARAIKDPAPEVRSAAIGAATDDSTLTHLATTDEDGGVRAAAMTALAVTRGRVASANLLLDRFAGAERGSAERVRAALAWHLAR